jgi:hypothetical protein
VGDGRDKEGGVMEEIEGIKEERGGRDECGKIIDVR